MKTSSNRRAKTTRMVIEVGNLVYIVNFLVNLKIGKKEQKTEKRRGKRRVVIRKVCRILKMTRLRGKRV